MPPKTVMRQALTTKNTGRSAVFGVLVAACIAWAPTSALAELIVLQSTAPGLKPGQVLTDNQTITIPAGKTVMLVLPNGATKTVSGPESGPASRFSQGVSRNEALLDAVKKYVVTGGTTSGRVGAMRSAAAPRPGSRAPFSWDTVPINADGDYCVAKTDRLQLIRSGARGDLDVTVVDFQKGKRAKAVFPSGTTTTAWPAGMEIGVGKYAFVAKGQAMSQVRLRVIDPLPSQEDTLRVLFTQRCEAQVASFLNKLRRGN
jgi:hypothetical protein